MPVLSQKLPSSTWVGALGPVGELRDTYQVVLYPLRSQDPAQLLHYHFLTAFPLFLHSLTPLISNSLNLPFGTQGRCRRLKPFSYKQEMGTQKGFCIREDPAGSCSVSFTQPESGASLTSAHWAPHLPHPSASPVLVPEAGWYPEPFRCRTLSFWRPPAGFRSIP